MIDLINPDELDECFERLRDTPQFPTWEELLARIKQGLPVQNERAVSVMRAMGAMPLTRYIDCLNPFGPEYVTLLYLEQKLPENATYQQAAEMLYQEFMASGRNKTGEAAAENARCLALFHAFATPVTQIVRDVSSTST